VFLIMYNTGQALPLVATRILRPRMSRGVSAEQPRNIIGSRPRQQPVREPGLTEHRAHPRIVHVREQSAIAFCPRPLTRQRTVLERGQAPASAIREQAAAVVRTQSPAVHDLGRSMSSIALPTRTFQDPLWATGSLTHCLRIALSPPMDYAVHIRFIST
jgi:hypothetical protein